MLTYNGTLEDLKRSLMLKGIDGTWEVTAPEYTFIHDDWTTLTWWADTKKVKITSSNASAVPLLYEALTIEPKPLYRDLTEIETLIRVLLKKCAVSMGMGPDYCEDNPWWVRDAARAKKEVLTTLLQGFPYKEEEDYYFSNNS